jgi:sulfide:quinone oxidoreductase
MATVLIVGGGFGGVVAAESLAKKLGRDHEITLVSRSRKFLFYPALVRFAFGQCQAEDYLVRHTRGDARSQDSLR